MPTTKPNVNPTALTRRLVGPAVTIRGHTLQPIAQLTGWQAGHQAAPASGGGAWLRVRPVVVEVSAPAQPPYTLAITDPTTSQLRALGGVALGIAAVALALMILVRRSLR